MILPRIGGTPADLFSVANHSNEKVRLEVLRALRTMPLDTRSMDYIATYLTDRVQEIRQHSAVLLRGELLSASAVGKLERVAFSEDQPEEVRRRVVEALGKCPLDAAATALNTLMQPRGLLEIGSLRDDIAVALRRSPAPLAAGYFAEGLKSPAWRVRKACERAVGTAS
jgi:HEAT repeat protein